MMKTILEGICPDRKLSIIRTPYSRAFMVEELYPYEHEDDVPPRYFHFHDGWSIWPNSRYHAFKRALAYYRKLAHTEERALGNEAAALRIFAIEYLNTPWAEPTFPSRS